MTLYGELFGARRPRCVALVGAGGKTSAIRLMARELSEEGARVIVTTTTKMHPPADAALLGRTPEEVAAILAAGPVAWAGVYFNEFKMQQIPGAMPALCAMADVVLVEADGARGRPLKMIDPAYEPQIPPEADAVVAAAGLDGIGRTVGEAVHRPALACAALGVDEGHLVTPGDAARLLRLCYDPATVLLNKADDDEKRAAAEAVARAMPKVHCVITSLRGRIR